MIFDNGDKEKRLLDALSSETKNAGISLCSLRISENGIVINYKFQIDGDPFEDNALFEFTDDIEKEVERIRKHIQYISDLMHQYPLFYAQNKYIQAHRVIKRKFDTPSLGYSGYGNEGHFEASLCGLLKLPNSTECSCGGGDYEIKRTPQRVSDFIANADASITFMRGLIAELEALKAGIPQSV